MGPFWKGAVTGALVALAMGGVALWSASYPKEPPPLIEKQLAQLRWPDAGPRIRTALGAAFPPGSKASSLREALGRSGFVVDGARHDARFVTGSVVCNDIFAVSWKEGPGDVLVSVDGGFSRICL
jgi:hypothetical protein